MFYNKHICSHKNTSNNLNFKLGKCQITLFATRQLLYSGFLPLVCRPEAHLAAVPPQDGVAHVLLGIHLQLVGILQRTLHAHVLNPILTRALPSAHNLTHNLPRTRVVESGGTGGRGRNTDAKT